MSTTKERIASETPPYFLRMRFWAGLCAAVFAAMTGALSPFENIPLWLKITLGVLTAVSTTIAGFTFLTTTDPNLSKK